jgi:two-component system heavy metal sensor histidine kinase CusS
MFRFFSLTHRLAIFFTMVAAAVVLGLGVLFLVATEGHFLELDQITLKDKQHLIENIIANAISTDDIPSRLRDALTNHHGLSVSVNDDNGNVIFRTQGFQPPATLDAPTLKNRTAEIQGWKNQGREFRALNLRFNPVHSAAPPLDVLIAIDMEHHMQFMAQLQRTLALYALGAVLVSGMLGWFAAYKGMAPLRAMKTQATTVSSHRLDERMPIEAVPVEMADLAQELNKMLDRLQNDFQRLSEFSSDLAHELRTPISNLLTQTQVALSARRDADTYRDILASHAEEFQRLARMVSDMLFLAKTDRGVDLPCKERFSAAVEVRALLDFYEAVAEEKYIKMGAHGDGEILGDRLMFRRAVSNLLSNALRHTPEKGEVQINVSKDQSAVKVTVENTGEEIDPKELPRLFDRFYRTDPARAHPGSDGAGLGLSITKAIVEAHGGKVAARSAQGRTQFSITFPAAGLVQCFTLSGT